MNKFSKYFLFLLLFTVLASLFFVNVSKAQEAGEGCLDDPENEFSDCLKQSVENCVPCHLDYDATVDPVLEQEILDAKIGTEGVSALKLAAKKLNPMDIKGGPSGLLSKAINALMAFMGSIALVLYIYAGFMWMSAAGNAERVAKAKNVLVWTTLGAVAMGASYMFVRIVLERVG